MTRATAALLLGLTTGCTTFMVHQSDISPNEREITTIVKGTAWFSGATKITGLTAMQTDSRQELNTKNINNQGATNVVEALKALTEILKLVK